MTRNGGGRHEETHKPAADVFGGIGVNGFIDEINARPVFGGPAKRVLYVRFHGFIFTVYNVAAGYRRTTGRRFYYGKNIDKRNTDIRGKLGSV